jgi:hypothetical protein
MTIHKFIRDKNFVDFKEALDDTNVNNEDSYGDTPIEMLVKNFNSSTEINISKLMSQILINTGANVDKINDFIDTTITTDNHVLAFYKFIKNAKKPSGNGASTPRNKSRASFQTAAGSKKSNYSAQEDLQLRQIAKSYNISVINSNHLAIKIINHLQNLKKCSNCDSKLI